MAKFQSQLSFISIAGTLLALAACAGMGPGGTAPGEVGGPVAIGNSLDGGSDLGAGGPLGEGGSGGEAVPSTQQSTDSIGGGCHIAFKMKIKILKNGSEQFCTASAARIYPDYTIPEDGVLAPAEDYSTPLATLSFTFPGSVSPITLTRNQNAACVGGHWETLEAMNFRYLCSGSKTYQVQAQAAWMATAGRLASSNTYSGHPVREEGNYSPIPVEVTIDLGHDANPHYELPEDSVNVLY